MGLILYITRLAECRHNTICLVVFSHSECRGDLTVYSTSSRIVQRTLDWGPHPQLFWYKSCVQLGLLPSTFRHADIFDVVLLRQGHGSPSSRECLDSFVSLWVGWAGWPRTLSCDRGVHNRGVFARTLAQHGVLIREAGVESLEQNWKS